MMEKNERWKKYIEVTKDKEPSPLVREALSYVTTGKNALDLGAGGLSDSRFLVQEGFNVTAVDTNPASGDIASELATERLTFVHAIFKDYEFPPDSFDLIIANDSLSFQKEGGFQITFSKLLPSLKSGGILAFNLLGDRDTWNTMGFQDRIFLSEEDVRGLLKDMDIIKFEEKEEDHGVQLDPDWIKHWHTFEIIARK